MVDKASARAIVFPLLFAGWLCGQQPHAKSFNDGSWHHDASGISFPDKAAQFIRQDYTGFQSDAPTAHVLYAIEELDVLVHVTVYPREEGTLQDEWRIYRQALLDEFEAAEVDEDGACELVKGKKSVVGRSMTIRVGQGAQRQTQRYYLFAYGDGHFLRGKVTGIPEMNRKWHLQIEGLLESICFGD